MADIVQPPELPKFPYLNTRMNLTCGVVGQPQPNITWYKDGVALQGERSTSLVILEIQLSDRGKYRCNATNFDPNNVSLTFFHAVSKEAVVNIEGDQIV